VLAPLSLCNLFSSSDFKHLPDGVKSDDEAALLPELCEDMEKDLFLLSSSGKNWMASPFWLTAASASSLSALSSGKKTGLLQWRWSLAAAGGQTSLPFAGS